MKQRASSRSEPRRQAQARRDQGSKADASMVYRLMVECVSGAYLKEPCLRVIEIEGDSTLEDLHLAIQEAVSFDNDHLHDFYAGRNYRHRKLRYSDADEWEDREGVFANLRLCEIYPLEGLKLYYWFDFGDDWIFEIRKTRGAYPAEPGVAYPRVIERRGPNPEQYPSWE
jgi:hypothetical protein